MRRFKNEGFFFWFKKLKKQKLEMPKSDQNCFFSKKKDTCTQKEGKNGTRKDMCFFF